MAVVVDEESLPISSLCRLALSLSLTPLYYVASPLVSLSVRLPTVRGAALYPCTFTLSKSLAQLSQSRFTTARKVSERKTQRKVVHHPPQKKPHTGTEIQAVLV